MENIGYIKKTKKISFYCDNFTTVKAVDEGISSFNPKLYFPKVNLVTLLDKLVINIYSILIVFHINGQK